MKRFFAASVLCALGFWISTSSLHAQGQMHTAVLKGVRGKHRFTWRFVTGPFRKKYHKATGSDSEPFNTEVRVDAKPETNKDGTRNWWGTDGGLPSTEFYAFQIVVDGRKWIVPKRLWSDCYDTDPSVNKFENTWAKLSSDGRQLAIGMYGSDGAGAYYVIWHLHANGRSNREFRSREEPKERIDRRIDIQKEKEGIEEK